MIERATFFNIAFSEFESAKIATFQIDPSSPAAFGGKPPVWPIDLGKVPSDRW